MKTNVGNTDRLVRLVIAIALLAVYFAEVATGWMGIAALVLAGVMFLTSVVGFCPLYLPFGISTCKCDTQAAK